jgi:hypothetical protein
MIERIAVTVCNDLDFFNSSLNSFKSFLMSSIPSLISSDGLFLLSSLFVSSSVTGGFSGFFQKIIGKK